MRTLGIEKWHTFVMQNKNSADANLKHDAEIIGKAMYDAILYPKGANTNTGSIYRIGTFMTYLINENRKRYFEDSLIFEFETFFYDKNPDVTVDRMKKL